MSKLEVLSRFDKEMVPYIRSFLDSNCESPQTLSVYLEARLRHDMSLGGFDKVVVSGETLNTSIYLFGNDDILLYTPFMDAGQNIVYAEVSPKVIMKFTDHMWLLEKNREITERLSLPRVVLINPSVKDVFPAPRFALCVASLAGYLRKYQKAEVCIIDMQIGPTIETIVEEIGRLQPEVIGISISFGQLNLATTILGRLFSVRETMIKKPVIVAGNVISAFGCEELITAFPDLIICNSEGESSLAGLVDYVKGKTTIDSVPGITYLDSSALRKTPSVEVDMTELPLPAMDTVPQIVGNGGALTMEISRGCHHSACSFCPRSHKPKKWKGMPDSNVIEQLEYYKKVFDRFGIERRIFMADEEFIGWMEDNGDVDRISSIASGIIDKSYNIHFESNARVDQIYSHTKDKKWHIERMKMFSLCRKAGLDRLLIGAESGSDSVLERLNKKIKSQDSVMAIRTLSALGIGLRITFITFDPLMNFSELKENVAFLGRRDAYLRPVDLSHISYSDLYDGLHDDSFVRAHSSDIPLYENVAYMLVLLEVLTNSDYVGLLTDAETACGKELVSRSKKPDINMARYRTSYLDPTIGDIAVSCQKWIDRHFALDYCLKGRYKSARADERDTIFEFRANYRRISYSLLQSLVYIFDETPTIDLVDSIVDADVLKDFKQGVGVKDRSESITDVLELFNEKMQLLVDDLEEAVAEGKITDTNGDLTRVIDQWWRRAGWSLINP